MSITDSGGMFFGANQDHILCKCQSMGERPCFKAKENFIWVTGLEYFYLRINCMFSFNIMNFHKLKTHTQRQRGVGFVP